MHFKLTMLKHYSILYFNNSGIVSNSIYNSLKTLYSFNVKINTLIQF